MSFMTRWPPTSTIAMLLALLAGCNRGLEWVQVRGSVAVDGKPVDRAAVLFAPIQGGRPTVGLTDSDGRFTLATDNRQGAPVGEYQVAITRYDMTGYTVDEDGFPVRDPAQPLAIVWLVPEKYSRLETSPLRATVDRDHREFEFDVRSRE